MKEQKRGREFERMLVEAVQDKISFFAWQSLGGVVEKCEFKIVAFRKDYGEIELVAKNEDDAALAKVISGNRMLNIYVPELSVSFTAGLKTITVDKKIRIHLPTDYSFYERRKHERVVPLKTCYASFELNRNLFKKSVFDLSLGGFAIILPKSDKVVIAKGKDFPIVVLDIAGRKIKVKAECVDAITIDRYKLDSLPYGGYKIAFRFMDISVEDREFLVEFVTHQILVQQTMKKAN
jgi:hypothetical protein